MLTELIVCLPLGILTYFRFIDWKVAGITLFSFYWLPKCIFVNLLNHTHPQVITHSNVTKIRNNDLVNEIALTFDDVPYYGTDNMEKIVASLDKYNMKGTFFVISDYVTDNNTRDKLVNMVKNGHQLANHGKTNTMHLALSHKTLDQEIGECDRFIKEIYSLAGKDLPSKMFYRPGCGAFNQRVIDLAQSYNYRLALGSVYPNDPMIRSSWINYYYIIAHMEKNDVVIMHDRNWTPWMLEKLLGYMKSKSFKSVTLDDLIQN